MDSRKDINDEFLLLARTIDSKLDPDMVQRIEYINIVNTFLKGVLHILFAEEVIPVGSCVDGSKVNVPGDCGDIDILIVSNEIILEESLFDYDNVYPAFLHIKVIGKHEKFFKHVINPIDGMYLQAAELKEFKSNCSFMTRNIIELLAIPGVVSGNNRLNLTRNSSVGKEQIEFDCESYNLDYEDDLQTGRYFLEIFKNHSQLLCGSSVSKLKERSEDSKMYSSVLSGVLNSLECTKSENRALDDEIKYSNTSQRQRHTQIADEITNQTVLQNGKEKENTFHSDTASTESSLYVESVLNETFPNRLNMDAERKFKINKRTGTSNDLGKEGEEIAISRLQSIDFVPAFKFQGWPRTATEWLTRARKWPTEATVQAVVDAGCQVVAKRPPVFREEERKKDMEVTTESDIDFRLSFALCEIVIAKSMSENQLLCWRVLKAYQKGFLESEPRFLTSYHWKNIIFWISEELDMSFWTNENVLKGVIMCLTFMKDCLSKRFLPFYFVREMNMIAGFETNQIYQMCNQIDFIKIRPCVSLQTFLQETPKSRKAYINANQVEKVLSTDTTSKQLNGIFFSPVKLNYVNDCFLENFDMKLESFMSEIINVFDVKRDTDDSNLDHVSETILYSRKDNSTVRRKRIIDKIFRTLTTNLQSQIEAGGGIKSRTVQIILDLITACRSNHDENLWTYANVCMKNFLAIVKEDLVIENLEEQCLHSSIHPAIEFLNIFEGFNDFALEIPRSDINGDNILKKLITLIGGAEKNNATETDSKPRRSEKDYNFDIELD